MSEEQRKVGFAVTAENQTKQAFDEIKRDAADMASKVEQSGKRAAQGVGAVGDGGDQAAKKLDASTRSIISSIQRATAATEAGEKGTSKYFETLAKQRGIGGDVLEPYLAQMRKAEDAQRAASASLGSIGLSAKQTTAALRQVPAQFTDIIVSLQGGQNPMTVFLQQGGQLKDVFGGAGAAAKALGGYVVGLINPFTMAAAAVAGLGAAYYQGSKEQDAFIKAIVTTGNISGVTSGQLRDYARAIDGVVGTQAQAAEGLAAFVAAGVRGGDELRKYTQTAIEWERATGQAVNKTAEQFASLQKDPLSAVLKLNEGTNFLTTSIYEQIKALTEQGRSADASKIAMDALDTAMRERSKAIEQNLGYIERGWRGIKGAAKEAWDAMLNVGRASTIGDQLSKAQAELDRRLNEPLAVDNQAMRASREKGIERLRAEIWALQEKANAEDIAAAAAKQHNEQLQARIGWDKAGEAFLSKSVQMERELAKAREEGKAAGASAAEIEERLAGIRDKYKDKGAAASERARNKELSDQAKLIAELSGLSTDFYKNWDHLSKAYARGALSLSELEAAQAELLAKQPALVALAKEEERVTKARVKAYEEEIKAQQKLLEQRERAAQTVENALQSARDEEAGHVLAAAAGITHAEAMAQLALARAEDNYQKEIAKGADGETLLALQREVEARRALIGVMQQKGIREANNNAAKALQKDWDKVSETIGRTLSDYIMAGGKDAATYLKRLFATLVLRPVVESGVASVIGVPNRSASGGIMGGIQSASNLNTLYGAASQAMYGGVAGASAASLGYANAVGLMGGDAIGALAAANGMWAGVATGAQAAAQSAIAANLAMEAGTGVALEAGTLAAAEAGAAGASSFAATLGAAAPWLAGGLAIAALLSSGAFSSRGANHSGGVYSTMTSDRNAAAAGLGISGEALGDFTQRGNAAMDAQLASAVGGLLSVYDGLAAKAGDTAKKLDIVAGFAVNGKYSDEDAYAYFKLLDKSNGNVLADYSKRDGGLGSDTTKAWAQFVGDMGGALVAQLKAADIPGWMRGIFDGLGDQISVDGLNQALKQIAAVDTAFGVLGKSMQMFAGISGELQTQLLQASGSLDALTANAGAFYQGFYSEAERMSALQRNVLDQLKSMDVTVDTSTAEAAKESFRSTVEQAMAAGQGELAAKLLAMSGAFAQAADYADKSAQDAAKSAQDAAKAAQDAAKAARDAAEAAYKQATDTAMANLQAAVDREKSYWQGISSAAQQAVGTLSSTLNLLTSNARELYGTVDATQQMLAAQGMVYIEDMLSAVRGGASVSGYTGLQDAIGAARGGINAGAYASQFERERDALVLAGQLSELGDLTDSQLTVQDRQLKAAQSQIEQLDKTLQYWQDALNFDALQLDATMTVAQAVMALGPLLANLQSAKAAAYAPAIQTVTGASPDEKAALYRQMLGSGLSDAQIRDQVNKTTGVQTDTDWDWLKKLAGVPGYAVGANYIPNNQLALLHEGEAVIPKAFNPWAGGQGMGGGNAELVAELRALRAEVAELRAAQERTASNTAGLPQMVDQFDNLSEGGNVLRTEVIA